MSTRTRVVARYLYPGALFAEETSRDLDTDSFVEACRKAPAEETGWFAKDRWYAVHITTVTSKLFTADDGEERWLDTSNESTSYVIGEAIHWEDIPETEGNAILRSNIRNNSKDGFGVKTRVGSWQVSSDYDYVIRLDEVPA